MRRSPRCWPGEPHSISPSPDRTFSHCRFLSFGSQRLSPPAAKNGRRRRGWPWRCCSGPISTAASGTGSGRWDCSAARQCCWRQADRNGFSPCAAGLSSASPRCRRLDQSVRPLRPRAAVRTRPDPLFLRGLGRMAQLRFPAIPAARIMADDAIVRGSVTGLAAASDPHRHHAGAAAHGARMRPTRRICRFWRAPAVGAGLEAKFMGAAGRPPAQRSSAASPNLPDLPRRPDGRLPSPSPRQSRSSPSAAGR